MKKLLFVLTSLSMSGMLFAANYTAKATLAITSEHVTSPLQLKLYEAPEYTADKETMVETEAFLNPVTDNAYVVNFYATCAWGSGKASKLAEFDLIGTKMTFQSNRVDNEYTMTFSNIVGTLYMKDLVTGDIVKITEGVAPYVFTQTADNSISERFEIVAVPLAPLTFINNVLVINEATAGAEVSVTPFSYVNGERVMDAGLPALTAPVNEPFPADTYGYLLVEYTNAEGVARKFIINANPDVAPAND